MSFAECALCSENALNAEKQGNVQKDKQLSIYTYIKIEALIKILPKADLT